MRDRRFEGLKFRRQNPRGRYIADFVCVKRQLMVEVDGESHDATTHEDEKRTALLESMGYGVVRVKNEDVLFNFEGVLRHLFEVCRARATTPSPQPSPPITGAREPEGLPL